MRVDFVVDPSRLRLRRNPPVVVHQVKPSGLLGANDPYSYWPTVTRAVLAASSPAILPFFAGIDVELKRPAKRALAPEAARDHSIERDLSARGRSR